MTLNQFKGNLKKFIKENPKALNLTVVASSDDEGNSFTKVHFDPTKGSFNEDGSFTSESEFDEFKKLKPNAVCIN